MAKKAEFIALDDQSDSTEFFTSSDLCAKCHNFFSMRASTSEQETSYCQ